MGGAQKILGIGQPMAGPPPRPAKGVLNSMFKAEVERLPNESSWALPCKTAGTPTGLLRPLASRRWLCHSCPAPPRVRRQVEGGGPQGAVGFRVAPVDRSHSLLQLALYTCSPLWAGAVRCPVAPVVQPTPESHPVVPLQ